MSENNNNEKPVVFIVKMSDWAGFQQQVWGVCSTLEGASEHLDQLIGRLGLGDVVEGCLDDVIDSDERWPGEVVEGSVTLTVDNEAILWIERFELD